MFSERRQHSSKHKSAQQTSHWQTHQEEGREGYKAKCEYETSPSIFVVVVIDLSIMWLVAWLNLGQVIKTFILNTWCVWAYRHILLHYSHKSFNV